MAYRVLVEDLVSGIVGMFHDKYEAPGKERRYIIEYKPPSMLGVVSKTKKLPSTVPPEGIVEIPGTKCVDGYPRLIVFSYGNDDLYPPLIPNLVKENVSEAIQQLDKLSVQAETKSEALEARQRVMDRNREKIVKDAMKLGKETQKRGRRDRGFISMDIGDE